MRTATRTFVHDQGSNAAVGRQSCELRTAPGLTQRQLADLVGTKQPVIPRLEDTDCEGHGAPGVRERRIWPARRRSNGTTRGPPRRRPWESAMSNPTAGYRAGPDGKDLGPDIDLVGPGEAYERWKKTPEYQKWLEETGQKK